MMATDDYDAIVMPSPVRSRRPPANFNGPTCKGRGVKYPTSSDEDPSESESEEQEDPWETYLYVNTGDFPNQQQPRNSGLLSLGLHYAHYPYFLVQLQVRGEDESTKFKEVIRPRFLVLKKKTSKAGPDPDYVNSIWRVLPLHRAGRTLPYYHYDDERIVKKVEVLKIGFAEYVISDPERFEAFVEGLLYGVDMNQICA
jgi:hypothetical protein